LTDAVEKLFSMVGIGGLLEIGFSIAPEMKKHLA